MGFFQARPKSEREIAEKNLKKGGVPELHPQPDYVGRFARYIVKDDRGRQGMDRWEVGYVISPGGKSYKQEMDEQEEQMLRKGWL
jgi:hypothetical protein